MRSPEAVRRPPTWRKLGMSGSLARCARSVIVALSWLVRATRRGLGGTLRATLREGLGPRQSRSARLPATRPGSRSGRDRSCKRLTFSDRSCNILVVNSNPAELDTEDRSGGRDLAAQRRQRLLVLVDSRRAARLEDLTAALGVSQATIRRDLDALAAEGLVQRVHGGVVAVGDRPAEPQFEVKAAEASEQKELIARRAVELLAPDETVYLDSGSTVLAAARLLHGWDRLTVVTNSLPVMIELAGRGPRLIVIGGELRPTSRALVGPLSRYLLENIRVDRALIGSYALSVDDGLSTTDPGEAYTKELALGRAREVILLADSRKLGTRSFVSAGRLEAVDILVTDGDMDDRAVRTLERRGIKVIRAGAPARRRAAEPRGRRTT
jgi:DeoR/GlpR family transcriptional regulator of sugar metabolism